MMARAGGSTARGDKHWTVGVKLVAVIVAGDVVLLELSDCP